MIYYLHTFGCQVMMTIKKKRVTVFKTNAYSKLYRKSFSISEYPLYSDK